MIRLSQVTLIRGTKTLLEEADVTLNPGDKIGLIGPNGSGKSSLFALLRGELHADRGEVDFPARWRIAHVAQDIEAGEMRAIDYVLAGHAPLMAARAELAAAEREHDDREPQQREDQEPRPASGVSPRHQHLDAPPPSDDSIVACPRAADVGRGECSGLRRGEQRSGDTAHFL